MTTLIQNKEGVLQSPYEQLLQKILEEGHDHADRTGKGRRSIFGTLTRYDVSDGTVPVPTTRKIYHKGGVTELLKFIEGKINIKDLNEVGNHFWDRWAVSEKDVENFILKHFSDVDEAHMSYLKEVYKPAVDTIGPMYGANWRYAPNVEWNNFWPTVPLDELPSDKMEKWKNEHATMLKNNPTWNVSLEDFCNHHYYKYVDQLNELIRNLKKRPHSSRLVVNSWIPAYVPFEELSPQENVLLGKGCLAACHVKFQCLTFPPKEEGGKVRLSLMMDQRSMDGPVGCPYNMLQYTVLLHMLAQVCDMEAYEFIHVSGDTHIYLDQIDLVKEQLKRDALPYPKIKLNPEIKDIFKFTADDVSIEGYQSHPPIAYPVAV